MPFDEWAPCKSATFLLTCKANGCFAPDQQLLFNQNYVPIAEAFNQGLSTFTTFDARSTPGSLILREEEIEAYVTGATEEDMATVYIESGQSLQVTLNHPMVLSSGTMVSASELRLGDSLATLAGPQAITRIVVAPFSGSVWNIEPKSEDTLSNIVIAEGFITGSIRHQNEWKEDQERWALRDFFRE